MQQLVLLIHVMVALAIIALVLLQHGKGADAGAAFGSGASQTMFGSKGALPFLVKITAVLAAIFFATSLTLGYLTARQAENGKNSLLTSSNMLPTAPANNKTQK